ncbi:MAG: PIN domain-containing protein [Caldilineaceae bacterium]
MNSQSSAFIDSNVLIRYLIGEPEAMALKAKAIIESDQLLWVSVHTLAEIGYVLESFYKAPRSDLVDMLMALIQRQNIKIYTLPKPLALDALRMCRNSKRNSFADALLWALVYDGEHKQLYTFDERFIADGITILNFGANET